MDIKKMKKADLLAHCVAQRVELDRLSGSSISNCNVTMDFSADGATLALADAMKSHADANIEFSRAMLELAKTLKPVDACAIRIDSNNNASIEG